ncbi:hypothetical protein SLS54_010475 [Diplodia seriata]
MDIQILLNPHDQIITTGDIITGRVLLSARRKVNVSAIDVRLRGYIRTSLLAEDDTNPETWKPYHAQHEFLRLDKSLFSHSSSRKCFWTSSSMTLSAGQHGFPFQFRLPAATTYRKDLHPSQGGDLLEKLNAATRSYDERGLPPSFKSDEIEIVYCIEATATRPDLFKENLHTTHAFNFRPIEQSRDPVPDLTSIKHQHQFDLQKPPSRPSSTTTTTTTPAVASPTRDLASILIDARLPAPAILTPNRPAPLSLTVRKVTAFAGQLYLRSLHVALIGYTGVQKQSHPPSSRGQEQQQQQQTKKKREKADTWVIASRSNLRVPIGTPDAPVGARMPLPAALWSGSAVPASVAPSFDVLCRGAGSTSSSSVIVTRSYELEVTLGLAYEAEGEEDGNDGGDDDDDELAFAFLTTHLLSQPANQAVVIDTTGTFDVLRLYNAILSTIRHDPSHGRINTAVEEQEAAAEKTLGKLKIMRVFDFLGMIEAISEVREILEIQQHGQKGQKNNQSHRPTGVEDQVPANEQESGRGLQRVRSTIPDSDDEMEEDEDEDVMLLEKEVKPPEDERTERRAEQVQEEDNKMEEEVEEGRVGMIVVDNITHAVSPMVKTNYAQGMPHELSSTL